MFTNLTPNYEFTDGVAFVVDDWQSVREGDKIRVYIPSLMSEIAHSDRSEEDIESIASPYELFVNPETAPNIPGIVTSINYVTSTLCGDLIISKANDELYRKYRENPKSKAVTHIPTKSKLSAGEQVRVGTDTGTIRDIYISN